MFQKKVQDMRLKTRREEDIVRRRAKGKGIGEKEDMNGNLAFLRT